MQKPDLPPDSLGCPLGCFSTTIDLLTKKRIDDTVIELGPHGFEG